MYIKRRVVKLTRFEWLIFIINGKNDNKNYASLNKRYEKARQKRQSYNCDMSTSTSIQCQTD